MKNKAKLWLLATGALTAAGVPALLAASCKVVPAYEKNEFVTEYNSQFTTAPFDYDSSRSYGGYVDASFTYLTGGEMFRIKAVKPAQVKSIINGKTTENLLVHPVLAKYQLGLAKAVVVTEKDGTVKVFDNDDADVVTPEPDKEFKTAKGVIKYYSNPNIYLTSKNEKSINSLGFLDALTKAKKVQIVIREGVKWTNYKGEATDYEVIAKDFFYSWIRTNTINNSFRHKNGGSEELDKLFRETISSSTNNVFTENQNYGNEYLFKVFGIDSSKFFNESEFVTKVDGSVADYAGKDSVTFDSIAGAEPQYKDFFLQTLLGRDMTFMPAPSQYIDEMNKEGKQPLLKDNGDELTGASAKKFLEELNKNKDNNVYNAGTYWYGTSYKSTLYSGSYYAVGRNGLADSVQKNLNHWDKEWVENKDTINRITQLYQPQSLDAALYANTVFNKYKQGTISQISYTLLTDSQQREVSKDAINLGYRLIKKLNAKTPFYFNVSIPFINNRMTKYNYGFNDAYAKLAYGTSINNLKADKQNRDSYIHGLGLSFRSVLNAAINWDELISDLSSGINEAWVAKVADGSYIGGSNQETSKYQYPSDAKDIINALSAVDVNGNKIDFGSLGFEINPSENAEANKVKSETSDKLKSAGWDILKAEMEKILAEFDRRFPEEAGKDIELKYLFPYSNAPDKYLTSWQKLEKVFTTLNPRLKITVQKFTNLADQKVKDEFLAWRTDGVAGTKLVSWSYDYNSIGSGYDGLSWGGTLIPTLINISRLESTSAFAKSFPKIYQLAKDLVEYEKTHEFVSSIPFADLDKASGYYYTRGIYRYLEYKMKLDTETQKYVLDLKEDKPQEFEPADGKHVTDAYEWSSIFWLKYVSGKTNEELLPLMQELSSYLNVNFTYNLSKTKEEFIKQLINKHYVTPMLSGSDATPYQDWTINKK